MTGAKTSETASDLDQGAIHESKASYGACSRMRSHSTSRPELSLAHGGPHFATTTFYLTSTPVKSSP